MSTISNIPSFVAYTHSSAPPKPRPESKKRPDSPLDSSHSSSLPPRHFSFSSPSRSMVVKSARVITISQADAGFSASKTPTPTHSEALIGSSPLALISQSPKSDKATPSPTFTPITPLGRSPSLTPMVPGSADKVADLILNMELSKIVEDCIKVSQQKFRKNHGPDYFYKLLIDKRPASFDAAKALFKPGYMHDATWDSFCEVVLELANAKTRAHELHEINPLYDIPAHFLLMTEQSMIQTAAKQLLKRAELMAQMKLHRGSMVQKLSILEGMQKLHADDPDGHGKDHSSEIVDLQVQLAEDQYDLLLKTEEEFAEEILDTVYQSQCERESMNLQEKLFESCLTEKEENPANTIFVGLLSDLMSTIVLEAEIEAYDELVVEGAQAAPPDELLLEGTQAAPHDELLHEEPQVAPDDDDEILSLGLQDR